MKRGEWIEYEPIPGNPAYVRCPRCGKPIRALRMAKGAHAAWHGANDPVQGRAATLSPGPALELARAVLESRESRPKNADSNTVFLDYRDWEYVKELARQVEEREGRGEVVGRATINRSKPGRRGAPAVSRPIDPLAAASIVRETWFGELPATVRPLLLGTVREWTERPALPAGWVRIAGGVDEDGAAWQHRGLGLRVIESMAIELDGQRWHHVSASRQSRIPSWDDMCLVHRLFIGEERAAYQVHVPRSRWISIHPNVLHLWSCLDQPAGVLPDFAHGGRTI